MEFFRLIKLNGLEILGIELNNFSLYFTTRRGGYSRPPYDTFNLSFEVGDSDKAVVKNRTKLAKVLRIPVDRFITLRQKHSSRILKVDKKSGLSFLVKEVFGEGDALITSRPLALTLFYADCLPIFLVEPAKKVAGLVHAGWRGLKEKIARKTVEKMVEQFGISPTALFAWLGPSIGDCCYQVSTDFLDYFGDYPESFRKTIDGQIFLNLKSIGHAQLLEAGAKERNIKVVPSCTSCQANLFFSYRREKGETGRHAAILVIRER